MKHLLLIPVALTAVLAFARDVQAAPAPDRETLEVQAVQKALYDGARALERNDADALARYYASEWLSVGPSGADLVSGKGFSATRNGTLHYDSIEIAEPITRVHGRAAVSTSRITVKGRNKGHDISGVYRVSTMLAKENGAWKIVALVSSPLEATHAPD